MRMAVIPGASPQFRAATAAWRQRRNRRRSRRCDSAGRGWL